MKKITSFLMLALLMFVSIGASAQEGDEGVMKVTYNSSDNPDGKFYRNTPSEGWIVATSGSTKRWVSNGNPEITIYMSANNMDAAKFTFYSGIVVTPYFVSIETKYRMVGFTFKFSNNNKDGEHNQTVAFQGESKTAEGAESATVEWYDLDNYTKEFQFDLTGTNTGAIVEEFTVYYIENPEKGQSHLDEVLEQYATVEFDMYPVGSEPGFFPEELVEAARSAYEYGVEIQLDYDLTDQQKWDAAEAILKAMDDLANGQVKVTLSNGYYYFINARDGITTDAITDFSVTEDVDAMWADGNDYARYSPHFFPVQGAEADPLYIWQVEQTGDNAFRIKNIVSEKYLQSHTGYVYQRMTDNVENAASFEVQTSASYPGFALLRNTAVEGLGNTGDYAYLRTYDWSNGAGYVVNYSGDNFKSVWKPIRVEESTVTAVQGKIQEIKDSIAQAKLNAALQTLVNNAITGRDNTKSYLSDMTLDGKFEPRGLITDTAQLSTNAQEPTEGPLAGVIDNSIETYFHSSWSADSPDPETYHFIEIDLKKAIKMVTFKFAKRNNNGNSNPATFQVYATNDPSAEENWVDCGSHNVTWNISDAEITDKQNFFGQMTANLGGTAYQYVRLSCTATGNNSLHNGYPLWYISEIDAYEAADDPNSVYNIVDANIKNTLNSTIEKAQAELKAEKGTQETYDALEAAYKDFLAACPDKDRLLATIEDCQAFVDSAEVGTDPGYFPEGATAPLQAVIDAAKEVAAKDVINFAEYDNAMKQLDEALEAFNDKLVMPADGLYLIQSITTGAGQNSYIYGRGSGTAEDDYSSIYWGFANDTELDNRLTTQWELKNVGGRQFTLRNIASNTYLCTKQQSLSGRIHLVAEPDTFKLRSARVPGAFNLQLEGTESSKFFANAQPGGQLLVAWTGAKGHDNSAFVFVPANYMGAWLIGINGSSVNVLTMPFEVDFSSAVVTPYGVKGKTATDVVLTKIDGTLEAGTPFIFAPNDQGVNNEIIYVNEMDNYKNIKYAAEPKEANGLVGALNTTTIDANYCVFVTDSIIAAVNDRFQTIAPNTGYFNLAGMATIAETDVAADDIKLPISKSTLVGIEDVIRTAETIVPARKQGIFTLQGVRLQSTKNLPKGVYIINGRKVIKK